MAALKSMCHSFPDVREGGGGLKVKTRSHVKWLCILNALITCNEYMEKSSFVFQGLMINSNVIYIYIDGLEKYSICNWQ